jgi:hypothetical protein
MTTRITWQNEPLANRPNPKTPSRRRSAFKTHFDSTMKLLEREILALGAKEAVLQVDVERSEIRLDGTLRADAKRRSPAVAVSFSSQHGLLTYPCDTYDDWRDNVRAIALALEALRAVDRYGVTSRGEQYTGWAKLPPPASASPFHSRADALNVLRTIIGDRVDSLELEAALRECEMATHPDRGGSAETFKLVQQARKVLLGTCE